MKFAFPAWTRKEGRRNLTEEERASARLRYLMNRLAVEHSSKASLKNIATHLGVSYTTIIIYIQRGHFSEAFAQLFHDRFGIDPSWLTNPLSISETA